MKTIKCVLLLAFCFLVLGGCRPGQVYYEESGSVFHTYYQIKYQSAKPLSKEIQAEFEKFDLSLNPFNPHSIISKINRNDTVTVDAWFAEVFDKAQEVSKNSEGVFDITSAPLINLWGFGFSRMDSVTSYMVDSIKDFVGFQKVKLADHRVVKEDPRIMLNCSAIAKGYASDIIARLLEREGVLNYMVEIGGEVTMAGVNPSGACWRIGINKPEDDKTGTKQEIEEVIQLCKKGGIATSGNYRNYYIKDGKKYAHTIDPRTGYPSEQHILSATIVAGDCMTADAYATAFMAMGVDKACQMADRIPEIEYYIIYADTTGGHRVKYSTGMLPYLPNRQKLDVLENP